MYSEKRDTQDEISALKARLAEQELKLKGLDEQIAQQAPDKAVDLAAEDAEELAAYAAECAAERAKELAKERAKEIAEELADEQEELELLRKQVADKVAYIFKLKQEAVANKPRGGHSVVCYHIAVDGEYYRYNLRGDMFQIDSDEFLGHWDGFKLDRSAKPPENKAVFPSFYPTKEFTGEN